MSLKNHPKALYLPVGLCYNRMRYMVMSFATCNQCYQQQYKQYQYLSGISKIVMAVLLVMKLKIPSQVELESYSATQCLGISLISDNLSNATSSNETINNMTGHSG